MEQGVINPDNLSQLLRNISQRRRQGTLEVSIADQLIQILFSGGKVVDLIVNSTEPVVDLRNLLVGCGLASIEQIAECEDLTQLYSALNQGSAVCEEDRFKQIVRERILEGLYSLSSLRGAYYSFKVQTIEIDRHFAPQISVGQLLLDFVALDSEQERFEQLFTDATLVKAANDVMAGLSTEEAMLLEALGEGKAIADLRRNCLLSSFHFHECMLALLERELIFIVDTVQETGSEQVVSMQDSASTNTLVAEKALAGLEGSIDSIFDSNSVQAQVAQPDLSIKEQSKPEKNRDVKVVLQKPAKLASTRPSAIKQFNSWMLQENLVADAVVFLSLLLGLLAPLFHWTDVLMMF